MTVSTFEQFLCLCRHHGFILEDCHQVFFEEMTIRVTVHDDDNVARFTKMGLPSEVFEKLSDQMDEYYRQDREEKRHAVRGV